MAEPLSSGAAWPKRNSENVDRKTLEFENLTAVNEYGFYCVPTEYMSREVPQVLLKGEVYEPSTLKLFRRLTGSLDIVSGGAFVGDFFPALSAALSADARLHSFEPNPLSYAAAQRTIELNNLTNIALHPVAVGEEPGTLPLQISKTNGQAMGARAKLIESAVEGETVNVEVTTLSDLVPSDRKVGLLHLDIEGHEWSAILGGRRLIEENIPLIVLEASKPYQQRNFLRELNAAFPDLGYQFVGGMERNAFYKATKSQ